MIRREITDTKSDYDREKLEERLARLSGGVAVIRVGAPSESEMKAKKEALDDAISSTKAAVAEGIVAGGGLALLRASRPIKAEESNASGDERTGLQILGHALEAPTRQIAENSAADGGVVVDRMLNGTGNLGFDASRKEFVDLFEAGIVDPVKVVRTALENAVSVASVLLLTEATMTERPEKSKEPVAMAPELSPAACAACRDQVAAHTYSLGYPVTLGVAAFTCDDLLKEMGGAGARRRGSSLRLYPDPMDTAFSQGQCVGRARGARFHQRYCGRARRGGECGRRPAADRYGDG